MKKNIDTPDDSSDKIELNPEKARVIIGEIPASLARWGVAVIIIISVALIAAICLLQYPYSNGETIIEHFIK